MLSKWWIYGPAIVGFPVLMAVSGELGLSDVQRSIGAFGLGVTIALGFIAADLIKQYLDKRH
jgi:hypothetical protein